jgi:hypothetical protein
MCTEGETRRAVGVQGAEAIITIVEGAWGAYVEEGRLRSRRTRANIVWEYMIEGADMHLAPLANVTRVEIHDTPWYVFNDHCALRMKLHSPRLSTGNVRTIYQQGVARQEPFPGLPNGCRLSCGYTLDRAEAGIDRIVITKRVRGDLEWWIDVRGLAHGELDPVAPILPGTGEGDGGIVIPLPGIKRPGEEKTEDHS